MRNPTRNENNETKIQTELVFAHVMDDDNPLRR